MAVLLFGKYVETIISGGYASVTRSAAEGTLRVPVVVTSLASKSFMVRSVVMWNSVPPDIRSIQKLQQFKSKLKKWIKANVDIE